MSGDARTGRSERPSVWRRLRRAAAANVVSVIVEADAIRVLHGPEQIVVVEKGAVNHAQWVEFKDRHWLTLLDHNDRTIAAIPASKLDREELTRQLALHRWPAPRPAEGPPRASARAERFVENDVDHRIGTWFLGVIAVALVLVGFWPWGFEGAYEDQRWLILTVTVVPALVLASMIPGRLRGDDPATLEIDAEFVRLAPPKGREVVVPRGPVATVDRTAFRNNLYLDFRDATQTPMAVVGIRGFDLEELLAALRRHGWPVRD